MFRSVLALITRVRIGPRLTAGFLIVAAACGCVGYLALDSLAELRAYQANASTNLLPSALSLDEIRTATLQIQRAERTLQMHARRDNAAGVQAARESIAANTKVLNDSLKTYAALPMDAKERQQWEPLQADLTAWRRGHEQFMTLAGGKDLDKADEALVGELAAADRLSDTFAAMMDVQDDIAKREDDAATARYATTRSVLMAAAVVTVLAALGLGLLITASITRGLGQAMGVLEGVAKGDLSKRADVTSRDEIGRLGVALNTAIGNLQEARERDQDFRSQIDAISKAQAVVEFKMDGAVAAANDNFLTLMGYGSDEIRGRSHSLFVDPAVVATAEYKEFWARLNRGESFVSEVRRVAKGGQVMWLQASYNPILDLAGRPYKVVKFATDITAGKAAQIEAARTKSMLDSAPLNVMFADRDHVVRYSNAANA